MGYIGKDVQNFHLGSNPDPRYIQNHVIMNRVITSYPNCVITRVKCMGYIGKDV